jgi:hypothetical protein
LFGMSIALLTCGGVVDLVPARPRRQAARGFRYGNEGHFMDAVVQKKKNCCVCGTDVSRMRRTKDPRGKYYCRPCYDTLWEAHQRRLREQARMDAQADVEGLVDAALISQPAPAASASGAMTTGEPVAAPAATASPEFQITALPASGDDGEPAQRAFSIARALSRAASALSALRASDEPGAEAVVHVSARRVRRRHIPRHALRLSDLVGDEAQEAVEAVRADPRLHEAEVPVSPITNLPVSALIDDYASLVEEGEPIRPAGEGDEGVLRGALFSNMTVSSAAAS